MSICLSGRLLRALAIASIAWLAAVTTACGGSSKVTPASAPSTGNWQFILAQQYPLPSTTLNVSGFMVEGSDGTLTGNLEVPALGSNEVCAGVSPATGSISGQNVSLTMNVYGTSFALTGTIATNGASMSGDYEGAQGACFDKPTTGTWNALLIPTLNGNFTGTITNSSYLEALLGVGTSPPIAVSGTLTQSDNAGASNASLSGTITAVDYPCFSTAAMSGTISGQNVDLQLYGYNGEEIGSLGQSPGAPGGQATPATVTVGANGLSLTSDGQTFFIGFPITNSQNGEGPCPPAGQDGLLYDEADISLNFSQ
jgi:hypothetical protein